MTVEEARMWKRCKIWGAVLDWCRKTTGRYRRFAGAGQLRMVGREDRLEAARSINDSKRLHSDFDRGLIEFKQFIEVLRIGDRVRVFCDDGVIEAEKISPQLFELIYAVETTGSIQ